MRVRRILRDPWNYDLSSRDYRSDVSLKRSRLGLIAAIPSLLVAFCGAAAAQSASQITPPSFRPGAPQAGGSIIFSGRPGLDAPLGAERLTVRIRGIAVEGLLPALSAENRALEARLVGRPIRTSELFAAVRELEAAYARAGYMLVRIVLSAQTLRDGGQLRIVVVSGYIERVDASGVPDMVRPRILAVVTPLVGQRGLTLAQIERRLLLAGDTPGVAFKSTLKPDEANGATTLVVEARHRPVSGFVGADNTLATALGRSVVSGGLDLNSVLGQGEAIYLRGYGHPSVDDRFDFGSLFGDRPRVRTLAAGTVVPIGVDGLTFNVEGTQSLTTPKAVSFQTASTFERLSLRLRYSSSSISPGTPTGATPRKPAKCCGPCRSREAPRSRRRSPATASPPIRGTPPPTTPARSGPTSGTMPSTPAGAPCWRTPKCPITPRSSPAPSRPVASARRRCASTGTPRTAATCAPWSASA
jgi:hypothetical protein